MSVENNAPGAPAPTATPAPPATPAYPVDHAARMEASTSAYRIGNDQASMNNQYTYLIKEALSAGRITFDQANADLRTQGLKELPPNPASATTTPNQPRTPLPAHAIDWDARARASANGYQIGGNAEEQHRFLIKAAYEDGHMTIEHANRELAEQGLAPLSPPSAEGPSINDVYDRGFSPPASANEYSMVPSLRSDPTSEPTDESLAIDTAFRSALHAGGFSAELGASLSELIRQTDRQTSPMNRDEREAWSRDQAKALSSLWGSDHKKNVGEVADYLLSIEKKHPGTNQMLMNSPASGSAMFFKMLHDQATRISGRRDGKLK